MPDDEYYIKQGCSNSIGMAVFFIVLLLCAFLGGCRCPECATTTETERIVGVSGVFYESDDEPCRIKPEPSEPEQQ